MSRKKGKGPSATFRMYTQGARQGQRLMSQQYAAAVRAQRAREQEESGSNWTPAGSQNPDVGVLEGTNHVVSFKTGGRNGDETLIADGDFSEGDGTGAKEARDAFDAGHDHYGSAREGGWIDQVRGFFSG